MIAFIRSGRFSVIYPIPSAIARWTTLTCGPIHYVADF